MLIRWFGGGGGGGRRGEAHTHTCKLSNTIQIITHTYNTTMTDEQTPNLASHFSDMKLNEYYNEHKVY